MNDEAAGQGPHDRRVRPAAWKVGASYFRTLESVPEALRAEAEPLYDKATLSRLEDWIEGDCRCPCCERTDVCVDDCTFAEDDPSSAADMDEARAVLYGA